MTKKSLMVVGECMVELSHRESGSLDLSYAGDTYNSLVYAMRWNALIDGVFYTAVGSDNFSKSMLAAFDAKGISRQAIVTSKNKNVGLYCIVNDENGERSFDYWRDQSAARSMMSLHQAAGTKIPPMDMVYFSGISLAILPEEDKSALLNMLAHQQDNGAVIAFDPNYRAQMWNGNEHARQWFHKAYQLANIALPGVEDHQQVFGHTSQGQVAEYLNELSCPEFVIKAGHEGMFCYEMGSQCHHQPFNAADVQRDTTAAGDSFAGVYLANRLEGNNISDSVRAADAAARIVVGHKGAIIDDEIFDQGMRIFKQSQCLYVQEPV